MRAAALALVPMLLTAGIAVERTKDGVRYAVVTPKPAGRAPVVFYLGSSAEQSLSEARFVACHEALGSGVLKVAIDLPGHGDDQRAGEPGSLKTWRSRLDAGEDVIAATARRATAVLDHLVASGAADPSRVAAFGTSRGGFLAFHWAAADARVRSIAAFAPVTELPVLVEFQGMPASIASTHAARLADRLRDRAIRIVIGSTDDRVGTRAAVEFAMAVVNAARREKVKPLVELHVIPTEGHTIPDSTYLDAAAWWLRMAEVGR